MFDRRTFATFLSALLVLHSSFAFYLMEDRYKKKVNEYEEVETITDPVKVKLLMSQPAKEEVKFTPVLIPDKFSRYDSIDHDGHISLKELIRTTGAERNAKNAFQAADKDADGEISQEEFKMAPWAMKPSSVDSKDDEDYTDEDKIEKEEEEKEAAEREAAEKEAAKKVVTEKTIKADQERKDVEGKENIGKKEGDPERVVAGEGKGPNHGATQKKTLGEKSKIGREGGKPIEKMILGVTTLGEKSIAGGDKVKGTEKPKLEGVKKFKLGAEKVQATNETVVGEKSKVGGEKDGGKEKKIMGGANKNTEEKIELRKEVEKETIQEKVDVGAGAMQKIGNNESVRNESTVIGKQKEGEKNEDEKMKEADNKAENEGEDPEYIEIEDLESHLQHSDADILDPHEFGSILDSLDDQLEELDNMIVEDLENNELIDGEEEETSGEIENDDNEESYSYKEEITNQEGNENFTD